MLSKCILIDVATATLIKMHLLSACQNGLTISVLKSSHRWTDRQMAFQLYKLDDVVPPAI